MVVVAGVPSKLSSVTYIFQSWVPGWLRRVLIRFFLEATDRGYQAGYQQGVIDAKSGLLDF